jgi:hypothetical protein
MGRSLKRCKGLDGKSLSAYWQTWPRLHPEHGSEFDFFSMLQRTMLVESGAKMVNVQMFKGSTIQTTVTFSIIESWKVLPSCWCLEEAGGGNQTRILQI